MRMWVGLSSFSGEIVINFIKNMESVAPSLPGTFQKLGAFFYTPEEIEKKYPEKFAAFYAWRMDVDTLTKHVGKCYELLELRANTPEAIEEDKQFAVLAIKFNLSVKGRVKDRLVKSWKQFKKAQDRTPAGKIVTKLSKKINKLVQKKLKTETKGKTLKPDEQADLTRMEQEQDPLLTNQATEYAGWVSGWLDEFDADSETFFNGITYSEDILVAMTELTGDAGSKSTLRQLYAALRIEQESED